MSNIYHGLLFLHGHILDPRVLTGATATSRPDPSALAQTRTTTSGATAVAAVARGDARDTCVTC